MEGKINIEEGSPRVYFIDNHRYHSKLGVFFHPFLFCHKEAKIGIARWEELKTKDVIEYSANVRIDGKLMGPKTELSRTPFDLILKRPTLMGEEFTSVDKDGFLNGPIFRGLSQYGTFNGDRILFRPSLKKGRIFQYEADQKFSMKCITFD